MSRLPAIAIGRRRRWLLLLGGNGLLQGMAAAAASLALGRLGAAGGEDLARGPLAIVALAALLLALLKQRELIVAERLGQDYAIDVRDRLYAAACSAGGVPASSLLLRFVTDLNGLRQWASRGLAVLIGDGAFLLMLLLAIAVQAPWLATVAAGGTLALGAVMLATRTRLHGADSELRRLRARLSGGLARRLARAPADLDLPAERRRLRRRGAALAEAAIERARWQGLTRGAAIAIGLLTLGAMLLVARHAAPAAGPGAVVSMIAIASLITAPLRRLARAFELRQTWRVARARAETLLRPPAPPESAAAASLDAEVRAA